MNNGTNNNNLHNGVNQMTNSVSLISFNLTPNARGFNALLPAADLSVAVSLRLSLRAGSNVIRSDRAAGERAVLAAHSRFPLSVPCLPGEAPADLRALLVSLGAVVK